MQHSPVDIEYFIRLGHWRESSHNIAQYLQLGSLP